MVKCKVRCVLKEQSPMRMSESNQYVLFAGLDDIPQSKTFGVALSKFDEMEPGMYPIKKVTSGEYLIFKSKSDASVWAKLIIKGKELKLVDNGIVSTFVESKKARIIMTWTNMEKITLLF